MTNTATASQKAKTLTARQSTPALVASLRMVESQLGGMDPLTDDAQAYRLTRAWIISELEHRFPEADAAIEAAFNAAADDEDVDYVGILLASIPGL
jgi:hypothetical protein